MSETLANFIGSGVKAVPQGTEEEVQHVQVYPESPTIQFTHYFHITNSDDKPVATCFVQRRHGVLFISSLWVDGPARKKGYGKRLLERVVEEFGRYEDLYLHVQGYTDRAFGDEDLEKWYGSFGFVRGMFPGAMIRKANLADMTSHTLRLHALTLLATVQIYAEEHGLDPAEQLTMLDVMRAETLAGITSEAARG
jgi:GNAT superfamily N-acetyltransferase